MTLEEPDSNKIGTGCEEHKNICETSVASHKSWYWGWVGNGD